MAADADIRVIFRLELSNLLRGFHPGGVGLGTRFHLSLNLDKLHTLCIRDALRSGLLHSVGSHRAAGDRIDVRALCSHQLFSHLRADFRPQTGCFAGNIDLNIGNRFRIEGHRHRHIAADALCRCAVGTRLVRCLLLSNCSNGTKDASCGKPRSTRERIAQETSSTHVFHRQNPPCSCILDRLLSKRLISQSRMKKQGILLTGHVFRPTGQDQTTQECMSVS